GADFRQDRISAICRKPPERRRAVGPPAALTAAPALAAVAEDFLYCLGLGLLLAALRDASGLIFGNGRVLGFVWDVAAFLAAAVALCGFAAGASAAGLTRWYMAAGLALGALSWHGAVSGA